MARNGLSIDWIAPLAEPYLRGFRRVPEAGETLTGCWFLRAEGSRIEPRRSSTKAGRIPRNRVGFFVGYLLREEGFAELNPQPPECLLFVTVQPPGGPLHERLVRHPDSLVRHVFTYIRWLTHHPPRFELYDAGRAAMVRHCPMRDWPSRRIEHFSRNFFIETLAWLVRSGLVRGFLRETLVGAGEETGGR